MANLLWLYTNSDRPARGVTRAPARPAYVYAPSERTPRNETPMLGHNYRFCVGDIVHLPGDATFCVVQWRGQLVLGPAGRRYRVSVYWLGEPHWDCYYEDEVLAVGQLPL